MERYRYRAVNAKGRQVRGVLAAVNDVDLYNQLQSAGLELLDGKKISSKGGLSNLSLSRQKVTLRDLIQFFMHLDQMQGAGVPLLECLADVRDTTENPMLRDIMSEVHRDVSDGAAMSEAMAKHPKVFKTLYISLIRAGEDTGDLTFAYQQLIKYLKWVDEMSAKIKKAVQYPIIVTVFVLLAITVMMMLVVPQIAGFIENLGRELPLYTVALMAVSSFFVTPLFHLGPLPMYGGLVVLLSPLIIFLTLKNLRKLSHSWAYRIDLMYLNMPVFGPIIRKITIARYAQTFGALFAAGIDIVRSLRSAKETVTNVAMLEALEAVEEYVQAGSPLSEAFNRSGEFPTMVVRMIKIGEESGKLTPVLDQVSEFYTKDVDEAVQGLITMIEPTLTAVMGGMIFWIALAVFGPVYESFEDIDI